MNKIKKYSPNYEENSNDETVASKVSEGKGLKKRSLKDLENQISQIYTRTGKHKVLYSSV